MGHFHRQKFFFDRYASVFFCTPAQTKTLLSEGRQLILLIRHGITDWNEKTKLQGQVEVPLNSKGREQAYLCGIGIKNALGDSKKIKNIYTSPLSRAYDTASAICRELKTASPITMDGFIERDYGSVTGMTFEDRRNLYRSTGGYPEDIESTDKTAIRMKKAIKEITDAPGEGISIVVTHGGLLNSFFSYITRGRAGSGGNIAANCTVEVVCAGKKDVIPIAFNLSGEELKFLIDEIEK